MKNNVAVKEDHNTELEHQAEGGRLSDKMIKRIQALIKGRLSRATFVFLGKGMYRARDSLSFRHEGHNINIRILQKYPPRSKKLSSNPKEFLIYAHDWTDCIVFNLLTVPAAHFNGKEVKVDALMDSLELNLLTHQIKYLRGSPQSGSIPKTEDKPVSEKPSDLTEEKNSKTGEEDTLGLDERTIRLILKVQKVMRGHLWRKKYNFLNMKYYRVAFSKSFLHEKHVINVRIMERIYKRDAPPHPEIIMTAQDFTDKVRFATVNYDKAVFGDAAPSSLTIQDVRSHIGFNVKTHIMKYKAHIEPPVEKEDKEATEIDTEKNEEVVEKNEKEEEKAENEKEKENSQTGLESQTPTHTEENGPALTNQPTELMPETSKASKAKYGEREEEAAARIQKFFKSICKNLLYITKVPLGFPNGKEFEVLVFFNKREQAVWLDLRSTHSEWQTIKLTLKELGLERFNKIEFLEDIDFYVLSHLVYHNNAIIFERGNTYTVSISKHEDPDSIITRKDPPYLKHQVDYVPEKIDTNFDYEKEFRDELVDKVLHEYVIGARYKAKEGENDVTEGKHNTHTEEEPPEIEQWKATVQKAMSKKTETRQLEGIKEEPIDLEETNLRSVPKTTNQFSFLQTESVPKTTNQLSFLQTESDPLAEKNKPSGVEEDRVYGEERSMNKPEDTNAEEMKQYEKEVLHRDEQHENEKEVLELRKVQEKHEEKSNVKATVEQETHSIVELKEEDERISRTEKIKEPKKEQSVPNNEVKEDTIEKPSEEKKNTENEQRSEGLIETSQSEKTNELPKKKKAKKTIKGEGSDTNPQETQVTATKKKKKTKKKAEGEQIEEEKTHESKDEGQNTQATLKTKEKKTKKSKVLKPEEMVDAPSGRENLANSLGGPDGKIKETSDSKKSEESLSQSQKKKKKKKTQVSNQAAEENLNGDQMTS